MSEAGSLSCSLQAKISGVVRHLSILNIHCTLCCDLADFSAEKKKSEKLPGKLEIREKLKVLFSVGTVGTIWQIFFFNVRNNPYEVFM
jgi:hypothetical protein